MTTPLTTLKMMKTAASRAKALKARRNHDRGGEIGVPLHVQIVAGGHHRAGRQGSGNRLGCVAEIAVGAGGLNPIEHLVLEGCVGGDERGYLARQDPGLGEWADRGRDADNLKGAPSCRTADHHPVADAGAEAVGGLP
jgi:hypothetical protein